jgi:ribulose-5-phosphate 4-epimerase/fuculose-1-phosphate aldolase
MPPIRRDLNPSQQLAVALRHLDDLGWCENLSGHITWQVPGSEHLLVNPWGMWWGEVRAADIITMSVDGDVIAGPWDVTPAYHLHTELHRRRPDARVVVHNHPMYATVLAGLGVLPEIIHQNSAAFLDSMVFVNEYDGSIESAVAGAALAERVGDAKVALLANHGVMVMAPTIEEATYLSANFERTCEIHYRTMLTGRAPLLIGREHLKAMQGTLLERASEAYWNGAIRPLIAAEPEVLEVDL